MSRIPSKYRKHLRTIAPTQVPGDAVEAAEEAVETVVEEVAEAETTEETPEEVVAEEETDEEPETAAEMPDYESMSYAQLRKLISSEDEEGLADRKKATFVAFLTEKWSG